MNINIHRNSKDQQPKSMITRSIQLCSSKKKCKQQASSSASKQTSVSNDDLLSSISRKLKVDHIEILTKGKYHRMTEQIAPFAEKLQININCLGKFEGMDLMKYVPYNSHENKAIKYSQLMSKFKNSGSIQIVCDVHAMKGQKKCCFEQQCIIKRKWMKNIIFYERELKNLFLLKQKISICSPQISSQIDKDVNRSFPQSMFPKTKLTVYQMGSQKYSTLQILRNTLKLYSVLDAQIGYVQGMNLIAAAIIFHMKQLNPAFIYFKQLMNYGKLRNLYLNDFQHTKQQTDQFMKVHLKEKAPQIYAHFTSLQVSSIMFVPYYSCLFASFVEIEYMHLIIDLYMVEGINFLHKFFMCLLLYLEDDILESQEDTLMKLSNSYIRERQINWSQIINLTQFIKFQQKK